MNWKKEAVEKLRRYESVEQALVNLPREISRLTAEYGAVGSFWPDQIPGHGDCRRQEDRLMNNIASRGELQRSLEHASQWMDTVERALKHLDPRERQVLEKMYIHPAHRAVEGLCDDFGVEKTSIYRRRDKALEKFTLAIYGVTESN